MCDRLGRWSDGGPSSRCSTTRSAGLRRGGRSSWRSSASPGIGKTRQGDGTGVERLTEREREIARLVVDQRTNGEIAAQLFLGRKTVETHLRNIFAKLGVSSRVDVARVVEAADREQPAP